MSYEKFAYLYDELMQDVPYDNWLEIINANAKKYRVDGKNLLDLACGTGELSIKLARQGYKVTGADMSPDMLAVAKAKADAIPLPIDFFQQDMTELEELGEFDIVGIFCDSLNYLEDEHAVEKTFKGVHRLLKEGGIFLFDVHSVYKMEQIFTDASFTWTDEEISYIWNSFSGDDPLSVEHELTFFVRDEKSGKYDRIDELHYQRTYPQDFYERMLDQAGFTRIEATGDYSMSQPGPKAERIFFAAVKP
ncbi:class I SAM-dependent methyltransferase [Bacillus sp. REN3]|uniref:class I SAM-dependent DNA methyltransferase n=1 Tax=Bacillus sp. REN3 TaxID=2802440 RepID=UPI001AEE57A4|nr:class I SAM-dependent methyltransferase [Bacillus sp. REN3]